MLPKHSTLDDFGDKIDWLIDKIKNTKVDMSDTFGLSSALINIAPLVGNWFNENVSPWFTKEKWQGMGQTIESSLSEKWTSFTTWWNQTGFSNWWKKFQSSLDQQNGINCLKTFQRRLEQHLKQQLMLQ